MRPIGQLDGEGEAGSHPSTAGDLKEGRPSRVPFICKEPKGFGH